MAAKLDGFAGEFEEFRGRDLHLVAVCSPEVPFQARDHGVAESAVRPGVVVGEVGIDLVCGRKVVDDFLQRLLAFADAGPVERGVMRSAGGSEEGFGVLVGFADEADEVAGLAVVAVCGALVLEDGVEGELGGFRDGALLKRRGDAVDRGAPARDMQREDVALAGLVGDRAPFGLEGPELIVLGGCGGRCIKLALPLCVVVDPVDEAFAGDAGAVRGPAVLVAFDDAPERLAGPVEEGTVGPERLEICRAADGAARFGEALAFRGGAVALPDRFDGLGELLVGVGVVAVDGVLFDSADEVVEERRFAVGRAVGAQPGDGRQASGRAGPDHALVVARGCVRRRLFGIGRGRRFECAGAVLGGEDEVERGLFRVGPRPERGEVVEDVVVRGVALVFVFGAPFGHRHPDRLAVDIDVEAVAMPGEARIDGLQRRAVIGEDIGVIDSRALGG